MSYWLIPLTPKGDWGFEAFFMSEIIMNKLINTPKTMTSREIADLVESRHDHVKTSIDRLVKGGLIQPTAMRDFKNSNNVTATAAEKKHMTRVSALGCIVFSHCYGNSETPAQVHHVRMRHGFGKVELLAVVHQQLGIE